MELNEYRTVGRSGLRVSPLTLGTMTFGDPNGHPSPIPSQAIYCLAWKLRYENLLS
jgi:aryl-alcohol dehydrogenase-like predicted oxidoreductase